jgi:hypothetical protein
LEQGNADINNKSKNEELAEKAEERYNPKRSKEHEQEAAKGGDRLATENGESRHTSG